MNRKLRRKLNRRRRRIQRRLDQPSIFGWEPVFGHCNIHYELAERARGIGSGGIGAFNPLVEKLGLARAIDRRVHLLRRHMPYFESDHVLNIAYNALLGGTCLDDIELRRNDEVFLDALGADRIPDPTTAGDFCRRFTAETIFELQDAIDEARCLAWAEQPADFFNEAILDMDGTLVGTTGECKQGMDLSYKGEWGYHPLIVSLANTAEVIRIINRPGNRPSHEGAWAAADDAMRVCFAGGFERVLLRGDTDFSQTQHLDRWSDDPRVRFIFGMDQMPNLVDLADELPENSWKTLHRRDKRPRQGPPRRRPENVKERIVRERGFKNLRLDSEEIAEFDYRPGACHKTYRMVVVKKNISEERGGVPLFPDLHQRHLFYITNDRNLAAEEIVFLANERCRQEKLIEQLKNGVRALSAPVNNLTSNWAYMVMVGLAWNLKAWFALSLPETPGRWAERHRAQKRTMLQMEFKRFVNAFINMPCQIVRSGGRLIYRLLSWNAWQHIFFRVLSGLRC